MQPDQDEDSGHRYWTDGLTTSRSKSSRQKSIHRQYFCYDHFLQEIWVMQAVSPLKLCDVFMVKRLSHHCFSISIFIFQLTSSFLLLLRVYTLLYSPSCPFLTRSTSAFFPSGCNAISLSYSSNFECYSHKQIYDHVDFFFEKKSI